MKNQPDTNFKNKSLPCQKSYFAFPQTEINQPNNIKTKKKIITKKNFVLLKN